MSVSIYFDFDTHSCWFCIICCSRRQCFHLLVLLQPLLFHHLLLLMSLLFELPLLFLPLLLHLPLHFQQGPSGGRYSSPSV